MQLAFYTTQESFLLWFSNFKKPYLKYQELNDQLYLAKHQYYINNSVEVRIEIQNIENRLLQLLDKYFNKFEQEEKLNTPNIEKIPRIDNEISQQTFIKRTKHKISWGVSDKDEYCDNNNLKHTFKINGKKYHLEYLEDIVDEYKTIFRRYEKTKVVIREKINTQPFIDIYKKENKLIKSKHKIIKLITTEKTVIISKKIDDVWKHETTNLTILKKIIKFIEKYNL